MNPRPWRLYLGLALLLAPLLAVACAPATTPTPSTAVLPAPPGRAASGVPAAGSLAAPYGSPVSSSQQTGLWVSGTGRATTKPDIALLQLGVEARDKTVAAAQASATGAMAKVMGVLKDQGVAEKDLRTTQFSIEPITRWNKDKEQAEITGYRVSNMVNARLRALDKVGAIIDAAAAAGGDLVRIQGISFTVEDPTPYAQEARGKAVLEAKAKAQQIAAAAGIALGKPIYISEGSVSLPVPAPAMRALTAEGMAAAVPISPGELEVTASIQMVYSLE
ncbi:MAG: SIMPL domain-containing protein [Chloroflexi bacterium]|nr:SIMPL domain-containing protein [Chloroflexota bacterium]